MICCGILILCQRVGWKVLSTYRCEISFRSNFVVWQFPFFAIGTESFSGQKLHECYQPGIIPDALRTQSITYGLLYWKRRGGESATAAKAWNCFFSVKSREIHIFFGMKSSEIDLAMVESQPTCDVSFAGATPHSVRRSFGRLCYPRKRTENFAS